MYDPLDDVYTPIKRTKLSRRKELGEEPSTPTNPPMALVHKADPVLDVVKIGGKPGEILLTKKGSGLEVINRISALEVGNKMERSTQA